MIPTKDTDHREPPGVVCISTGFYHHKPGLTECDACCVVLSPAIRQPKENGQLQEARVRRAYGIPMHGESFVAPAGEDCFDVIAMGNALASAHRLNEFMEMEDDRQSAGDRWCSSCCRAKHCVLGGPWRPGCLHCPQTASRFGPATVAVNG